MIEIIIFIGIWIIISEVIYILMCKRESKKQIKEEWFLTKFGSLIGAAFVTLIFYFIYQGLINYTKIFFIVLGVIIGLVLFFYLNYKLGLSVAKKPKNKISHNHTNKKNHSHTKSQRGRE